ncbi:MAG: hypothetical protein ACSLFN_03460 [Candidatus Limnocylindrales bacterium]
MARPRRARLIGFGLGALVGAATTGILLVAGLVSGVFAGASFALLIGPDGIFAPDRGAPFALAAPPIAAAVAGAIVAPWAARRPRWAGMTMGFVTYLVGIVSGPLFVLVLPNLGVAPTVGSSEVSIFDSLLSLVFGVGILWFVGAVLLAPLLAACVVAGIAWAALLRRVVDGPVSAASSPTAADTPLIDGPLVAMVVVAGVLGVLWLLLTAFLQLLANAQLD